jgi:putative hemolysin
MEVVPQLILVIVLVLLNGFFVASEFALVAIRKTRVEELVKKNNKTAKLVQDALGNLDKYISSTQLGITIASLALGWVGEPVLAHMIEPLFAFLPSGIAGITSHTIAIIIAFSIITFLHVVLGELAPKSYALQKPERTSLWIIAPLAAFTKVFSPLIFILNGAGGLVLKLFGITPTNAHSTLHSEEEIKMILGQSGEGGLLEKGEVEMVYNVFKLGDIPVKQIMVPRTDIIAFDINATIKEIVKKVDKNTHSRFPVFDNTIDNIIGFIHVKDIYKEAIKRDKIRKISQTNCLREILSVPETKRADEVLLDMRKKRIHLAVVNDEYGGTAGILTLEDVLESLVGEIEDEFENPQKDITKNKDGTFLIDGSVTVERVQRKFNLPMKGQGYTTIGGLIFGLLGREPKVGDSIQVGNIQLEIENIDRKRIRTIKLSRLGKKKPDTK